MKQTRLNQRTALAWHFGWDWKEIDWYQEASQTTKTKIMTCGDKYFCAVPLGSNPPKKISGRDNPGLPDVVWTRRPDALLEERGWAVYETTAED